MTANLFVTKLTADSCELLEQWIEHELKATELCEDETGHWHVSVYHFAGSQLGAMGTWKINVTLQSDSLDWNTSYRYDTETFNPALAMVQIRGDFMEYENAQRLARDRAANKRMRDRIAAELTTPTEKAVA